MNLSVFGMGYVGCVSAACLARDGHNVIGVDINPDKVNMIGMGQSPIREPGLDQLLQQVIQDETLCATTNASQAVLDSEASIICVGTPSQDNGNLKLDYVRNVCRQIGDVLAEKDEYHTIIVRSTVLPGTVRDHLLPILEEHSGKRAGDDFGLAMNPEFLREGSAISDYDEPSLIVIGEFDRRSGDVVEGIYASIDAESVRLDLEAAEMIKYVNNAFHALKVTFSNEVGNLSKRHGIDGRQVMDVLCRDTKLNISSAYLRPGFAFGGSCLPKDVRALKYRAKELDLSAPLLESLLASNQHQIERGIRLVEDAGNKRIAVLGLSFKANTDDVRESPTIALIETLVGRGYQVDVYDEHVDVDQLIGANRAFLEREIPHIATLMRKDLTEVLARAETVVIANGSKEFRDVGSALREDQMLVDLVGIDAHLNGFKGSYDGICW